MACEIGDEVVVSQGRRSIAAEHRLEAYATFRHPDWHRLNLNSEIEDSFSSSLCTSAKPAKRREEKWHAKQRERKKEKHSLANFSQTGIACIAL